MGKLDKINTGEIKGDLARPQPEERKVLSTRLLPATHEALKDIKRWKGVSAQRVIDEGVLLWLEKNPITENK